MIPDDEKIPVPPHLRTLGRDLTLHDWRAVIRRLRSDPSVKLVGQTVVTYGNRDGTKIHPGIERLANVCNLDDRTVKVALTKLRNFGLLHRTVEGSRYGRRGGISDEYVATVPRDLSVLPLLPPEENDPVRDAKRAEQRAKDAARRKARKAAARRPAPQEQVISDPEQVISDPGSGDLSSRPPGSEITPPVHRPVHRPSHGSHHSDAPRRDRAAAARPETFAEYRERHRALRLQAGETLTDEEERRIESEIAFCYVVSVVGQPATGTEMRTIEGMLASGAHPKAVVNKVLKGRGESVAEVNRAKARLQSLPYDVRQALEQDAAAHVAAHFPNAGPDFHLIYAARLADRQPDLYSAMAAS